MIKEIMREDAFKLTNDGKEVLAYDPTLGKVFNLTVFLNNLRFLIDETGESICTKISLVNDNKDTDKDSIRLYDNIPSTTMIKKSDSRVDTQIDTQIDNKVETIINNTIDRIPELAKSIMSSTNSEKSNISNKKSTEPNKSYENNVSLPHKDDIVSKDKVTEDTILESDKISSDIIPIEPSDIQLIHSTSNDVRIQVEEIIEDDKSSSKSTDDKDEIDKRINSTTIDLGKLYALKRAKWKIKDIAIELNCSISTVNRYIHNKEIENRVFNMQNIKPKIF